MPTSLALDKCLESIAFLLEGAVSHFDTYPFVVFPLHVLGCATGVPVKGEFDRLDLSSGCQAKAQPQQFMMQLRNSSAQPQTLSRTHNKSVKHANTQTTTTLRMVAKCIARRLGRMEP